MKKLGAGTASDRASGSGPRRGPVPAEDGEKAAVMAGEYRDGPPRKVLFVIHHAVFGGPHNQALRLAGPLGERGYETIVLLPDMPGDAPERLRRSGIAVEQMPLHSLRARPDPVVQARFALGFLPEVLAIRHRIRELGIDLVQIGGLVNPHAALAARAEGVPVVWQLLDTRAPRPVAWASMLWVRALATVVMPTGRKVLSAFPGWRRVASRVVPFVPPVDTDTFRPQPELRAAVRRQWGIAGGVPVIGSVANINPQKGIAMLIEAFDRLRREIPEACLVVVGAEYATHRAYSRELRRRMTELGLEEGVAVRFLGARSDIERQLQGFDLLALASVPRSEGIPTDVPYAELARPQQRAIVEGKGHWGGVHGFFAWLETKKYKLHVRVFLAKYRGYTRCPECNGGRLRQEARDVRVGERTLPEICKLPIKETAVFFETLTLSDEHAAIADKVLFEVRRRLKFLVDVGLDYLTLDRLASTLSGGEAQRIQLATNLGSALVGALYVLDEPSIGLHPRDSERLIKLLHNLRDIGNTVLVVEHDPDMMRAADHILDVGPAAGELGGRIVFEGDFAGLLKDSATLTGKYLRGEVEIKEPKTRRTALKKKKISVRGASEHNLQGVDVDIPLEMFVCITGVSGSGKSTLVHDVLFAGLKKGRGEWQGHVGAFQKLDGGGQIEDVVLVDQSPIGRTPRSNPVTYIKVYDGIREVFAATRDAQAKGFDASHFSFNVPGGRCDVCEGDGTVTVEMQFLADVELQCEECKGTRFKSNVLDVRYRGKGINDVLNMTVREALTFFRDVNKIANKLRVLDEVGLGYLRLGQSATTLSGGEAQRIKLASFLAKRMGAKTLYIFDEPTTGLHFDDINKLLAAFRTLVETGGSLLVIEHNLDVIKTADYIIDLGPEGGDMGGEVVATGTPEEIMKVKASHTGRFLKAHLARSNGYAANGKE